MSGRNFLEERIHKVHIDLIGPLPISDGNRYCLTMIDRATRWPEVVPIPDTSAKTVAEALISNWIARFGCPSKVTTDQGRQFESNLFHELSKSLGTKRIRTCAYHPQSNGLIENFHRTLKTAITSGSNPTLWAQLQLPIILLILHTSINTNTKEYFPRQNVIRPGITISPVKFASKMAGMGKNSYTRFLYRNVFIMVT